MDDGGQIMLARGMEMEILTWKTEVRTLKLSASSVLFQLSARRDVRDLRCLCCVVSRARNFFRMMLKKVAKWSDIQPGNTHEASSLRERLYL